MRRRRHRLIAATTLTCGAVLVAHPASAHSGPPYPIVTNQVIGSYKVSVWTDPDTTDDGSPAGKFWVTLAAAHPRDTVPGTSRARISVRPLDRPGSVETAQTEPVRGDVTQQFTAFLMDHEGPFGVHVAVDGPLGHAELDTTVQATYDLRPARALLLLYLMPFLLVGLLWGKLLLRRRQRPGRPAEADSSDPHRC
jgi:hypothetical protein